MNTIILLLHIVSIGMFWKPSYSYLLQHTKDSKELSRYFKTYFEYTDKIKDPNWMSPAMACRIGKFDCSEYAVITQGVLEYIGYECILYVVYNENDDESVDIAHAIVAYKNGSEYGIMSNGYRYDKMTFMEYMELFDYSCWDIIPDYREYIN